MVIDTELERVLTIEIYNPNEKAGWAQARYFVSGIDDVLWTDDLDLALQFIKESIEEYGYGD